MYVFNYVIKETKRIRFDTEIVGGKNRNERKNSGVTYKTVCLL